MKHTVQLILCLACLRLFGQFDRPCGVSGGNFIRLYDESGGQLKGREWRAAVFYGYPGETPVQFSPITQWSVGWAHPAGLGFPGVILFDPPEYPYIQLQIRVWNTNSALTWDAALAAAQCDSSQVVFVSKVIQQNPWDTHCECGGSTLCDNHRLSEFSLDRDYRFVLQPLPPQLRLRPQIFSDGLHLHVCHRGEQEIVLEESRDLVQWNPVVNFEMVSSDEFLIPTSQLLSGAFFRIQTVKLPDP